MGFTRSNGFSGRTRATYAISPGEFSLFQILDVTISIPGVRNRLNSPGEMA